MLKHNLSKLKKVTHLDLSGNRLGTAGAAYLADALKVNFCVTSVNLRSNGLRDFGAVRLCEVLLQNW